MEISEFENKLIEPKKKKKMKFFFHVLLAAFLFALIARTTESKKLKIMNFKDRTDLPQNSIEIDDKKDQIEAQFLQENRIPPWALRQQSIWGSRFFFKRSSN